MLRTICSPRKSLLVLFLSLSAMGCVDDREPFSATICLNLRHHELTPSSATVWRNYGDTFPGYGPDMEQRFDQQSEMGPTGRVCFDQLNPGIYWFAAEGWDEFIADSIRGSKRMEVTTQQRDYEATLSMSEQH